MRVLLMYVKAIKVSPPLKGYCMEQLRFSNKERIQWNAISICAFQSFLPVNKHTSPYFFLKAFGTTPWSLYPTATKPM